MGSSNTGALPNDSGSGIMSVISGALGSGGGGGSGKGTPGGQAGNTSNLSAQLVPMLADRIKENFYNELMNPSQPRERSIDQGPFVGANSQSNPPNEGMK